MTVRTRRVVSVALLVGVPLVLLAARSLRARAVEAVPVRRTELVQTLVVNGRVLAPQRVTLGSIQAGIVVSRSVNEGDRVVKGQVLAQLDERENGAALGQAEARLQQVRQVGTPSERAALEQAEANLANAERQFARIEQLARDGVASTSQLDDARTSLDVARAARDAARERAKSSASGSDLRLAEAGVAQARARLDQLRVVAPADGVILSRAVEVGDAVQPGRTLFTMAIDRAIEILVQPDERYLSGLSVGQQALVSADAYPDRRFPAEVYYIAPAVDPARGTIDLKLRVPDPPPFLRADMTVSAEIVQGRRAGALTLPRRAVRDLQSAPCAFVVRGGRAERVPLELGLHGERDVEILRGLAEGDQVVLDPGVTDGQRVRVKAG